MIIMNIGGEDCLYLNVFVPDSAKHREKLPVMFWVHGGGYTSGSGSPVIYGPDYLVPHNVILVTINYRLGALGFLCLDMEGAAGNMALKDQALALRWVNKHIATFGGDPDNVTLFGESAGASAVQNLVLGIPTQGLFHKAIFQSGSACSEWSTPKEPVNVALSLEKTLGCKSNNKKQLLECLKQVPVEKLVMAFVVPTIVVDGYRLQYAPVVEKRFPNSLPFMTEHPRVRMERKDIPKIPIMAGCVTNEGFMMLLIHYEKFGLDKNQSIALSTMIPDFKTFIPQHLQTKFNQKEKDIAAQKIKDFYFPDERDVVRRYFVFQSDFSFIKDIDFTIKKFSQCSPTFFYNFSFRGSLNLMRFLAPTIPYEGASHTDELGYLFALTPEFIKNAQVSERENLTIKRMTEMWTNFAKYGDPTPKVTDVLTTKWKPVTGGAMNCLDIGDSLALVNNPYKQRMQFWESLEKGVNAYRNV